MTISELLNELNARDIKMSAVNDDLLRLNAPVGALTPELKTQLTLHKAKLILIAKPDLPDFRVLWRDVPLPDGGKDREPIFICSRCNGRKFWAFAQSDTLPSCSNCRPFTGIVDRLIRWIEE